MGGIPSLTGTSRLPLPDWVEECIDTLLESAVPIAPSRPDHVLLNLYLNGQGIASHFDSPLYHPFVAVFNLQSSAMFHFYRSESHQQKQRQQQQRQQELQLSRNAQPTAHCSPQQQREQIFQFDRSEPNREEEDREQKKDSYDNDDQRQEEEIASSVFLERRSLLIFLGLSYWTYKHGIPRTTHDVIHENVANLHLLSPSISLGAVIPRAPSKSGNEEASARLSLTIRTLAKVDENWESIETLTEKDEARRREAHFYHSVSE